MLWSVGYKAGLDLHFNQNLTNDFVFLLIDSELLQPMEVKCHLKKAKPDDVPKFPSRKEEQTFDCFNKTVISSLLYFISFYAIKNSSLLNDNWKLG